MHTIDTEAMNKLFTEIDLYVEKLFLDPDPSLDKTIQSIHEAEMPQISIYPNLGAFLRLLLLMNRSKRVLEIGTLGGYSSIWLARGLPEGGRLVTLELQKSYAEVARKNIERAGLLDKVDIRIGDALELMQTMIDKKEKGFDFIFLDAHKPSYEHYLELALSLTHPGSLIVADNVIRSGEVVAANKDDCASGIHRFNTAIARHPSLEAVILSTASQKGLDGIAIALVT